MFRKMSESMPDCNLFKYEFKNIEYEAPFLRKGGNTPTRGTNPFTGFMAKLLMPAFSSNLFYHALEPDIITVVSSDFNIIKGSVSVIHTPGHTPGSQIVVTDNEIAVVGDAMFGVFPGSVFPPFGLDSEELVRSWGKLLETKANFIFLPTEVRTALNWSQRITTEEQKITIPVIKCFIFSCNWYFNFPD